MESFSSENLKLLFKPVRESHKGQNGKLLVIGGSHLFHAASLWSLTVAARIVDLVHYSSVPENNDLVVRAKDEFRNGIVVPRSEVESYVEEDDCILIGPGMVRNGKSQITNHNDQINSLSEIEKIKDEGEGTEALTNYLLSKFPKKQWVIDAGALQMMDLNLIPAGAILTPHHKEFADLVVKSQIPNLNDQAREEESIREFADKYKCIVLLKGAIDLVAGIKGTGKNTEVVQVQGGNAGMTKGGTGDVLAGLVAALACKNDPYLAACSGSFINKKAGEALYGKVGPYFNATDLANQIPETMKQILYPES